MKRADSFQKKIAFFSRISIKTRYRQFGQAGLTSRNFHRDHYKGDSISVSQMVCDKLHLVADGEHSSTFHDGLHNKASVMAFFRTGVDNKILKEITRKYKCSYQHRYNEFKTKGFTVHLD